MRITNLRAFWIVLVVILICAFTSTVVAQANGTITLTNGSKLNAEIKTVLCEARSVVFNLDGAGVATVRWDGIASMTLGDVRLTNDIVSGQVPPRLVEALMAYVKPHESVVTSEAEKHAVTVYGVRVTDVMTAVCTERALSAAKEKELSPIIDARIPIPQPSPGGKSVWRGKFETSSVLTIGTQTQETLSGRLALSYERNPTMNDWVKHSFTAFEIEAAYGNSAKKGSPRTMTNQVWYAGLTHGFIKSRTTIFPFAKLYHNFSQGMKLEQAYGVGIKHSFRPANTLPNQSLGNQLKHNLVLGADVRALHESFGHLANPFSSAAMGVQLDDSYNAVLSPKLTLIFNEHFELVPAFRSAQAFQARAESSLSIPVTQRLSVGLTFNDFYVRNAPPKHRQNYSKTTLSFGYLLGKIN